MKSLEKFVLCVNLLELITECCAGGVVCSYKKMTNFFVVFSIVC